MKNEVSQRRARFRRDRLCDLRKENDFGNMSVPYRELKKDKITLIANILELPLDYVGERGFFIAENQKQQLNSFVSTETSINMDR
jgi:hypothetical protein